MSPVMASISLLTLTVLAEDEPNNTGPDFGKASPSGLLIVVLLLIATFFLVWSMNRQLKKVPESFDDPADEADSGGDPSAGVDVDIPESPGEDPPHREPGG